MEQSRFLASVGNLVLLAARTPQSHKQQLTPTERLLPLGGICAHRFLDVDYPGPSSM